jgi:competence protein ComEA
MLYGKDERLSLKEYISHKPIWIWILIVILFFSGLAFGLFGSYRLVSAKEQEIVTSSDVESQVCEQTPNLGQITAYISGAVVNPGVYVLESGDRIVDLLKASGGLSNNSDKVFINRQFNLAKLVSDGDQIYIPTIDETEAQIVAQTSNVANNQKTIEKNDLVDNATQKNFQSAKSLISINISTKSELMQLSGIGEARATKIIDNRPYTSLSELVEKSVISQNLFNDIESQIGL